MTPEILSRIFDPFFTTKVHGSGLGLAAARRMLQDGGADLTVCSTPGDGSAFTIWLPAATCPGPTEAIAEPPTLLSGTEHILLVEDQTDLRTVSGRLP